MKAKNESYTTTYGFVCYKHRANAAKAIEMFHNYKIGGRNLIVKYANDKPENSNSQNSYVTSTSTSNPLSPKSSKNEESDDGWENVDRYKMSTKVNTDKYPAMSTKTTPDSDNGQKKTMGRGIITKKTPEKKTIGTLYFLTAKS